MTRRMLMLMLLIAVEAGCPETWGKEGAVDMAVSKSIREERERRSQGMHCNMLRDEWMALCDDGEGHHTSSACPEECRPK